MKPLRHTEECARIVSNLTMRCNCGARRYQRSIEGALNDARFIERYVENNDAPAVSWLAARIDAVIFYLDTADASQKRRFRDGVVKE